MFTRIPDSKTNILIRSKQDRYILVNEEKDKLINYINHLKVEDEKILFVPKQSKRDLRQQSLSNKIDGIIKIREERKANLELRFGSFRIPRPRDNKEENYLISIPLFVVDVHEKSTTLKENEKIHWRLITTHSVMTADQAWEIVEFYRKRWTIEQFFRAAKKGGLKLEEIESTQGKYIEKLAFIGLVATIKILQLTYCRDQNFFRLATTIFSSQEIIVLNKLKKKYQGKTTAQKNPFKKNTVPWAYWIVGRHGGWKGYASEGPAGPIIIKRGLDELQKNLDGIRLFGLVCMT